MGKKDDEAQQDELADILQNKTKPSGEIPITLAVDDVEIVHPVEDGGSKDEPTPQEDKKEEELEEIFQNLTTQNHLISLALNGSKTAKAKADEETKQLTTDDEECETKRKKSDSDDSPEEDATATTASTATKENRQRSKPTLFTGRWWTASLGTAAQILAEAQPSPGKKTNAAAAAPEQTPKDGVVVAERHHDDEDIKQETQPSLLLAAGTSLRKVDATTPREIPQDELELRSQGSTERVPENKVEEVPPNGTKVERVHNVVDDEVHEEGAENTEEEDEKEPSFDALTKAAQAAADSISQGGVVHKAGKNGVSTKGTAATKKKSSLLGPKAKKDLHHNHNRDGGNLTNFVAAAAILGAGIGAAVLGAGSASKPTTMMDEEDLIKMMD